MVVIHRSNTVVHCGNTVVIMLHCQEKSGFRIVTRIPFASYSLLIRQYIEMKAQQKLAILFIDLMSDNAIYNKFMQ